MREDNKIPKGWVETTLGEVVDKMYSGGTPSTKRDDFYNGNIPWIRTQEVTFNRINKADIQITELGLKNSSAKYIPINTVIVAMYGNSAGRVAISKIEATTNQACCNIVSKLSVSNAEYIFYNLLNRYVEIKGKANGAAQQNLSVGVLKDLDIFLPPLPEQQAIASILTTFDDKIELLQAQNQTLEATAQTIFKEWFGKYQVGDELPEGWRVGKYQEIVDLSSGKGVNKSEYIVDGQYEIIGANGSLGKLDKFLIDDKIIVTGRVGTLGTVFIINTPVWISDNVLITKPKNNNLFYFTYFTLKGLNFTALNTGSTQPLITQGDLKSVEIILPNEILLQSFEKVCSKLFRKIEYNSQQIQTLQQTRDTLLPKLMSGKVRVDEFKE